MSLILKNLAQISTGEHVGGACILYSPSGNIGYNIDRTPCKTQICGHQYYQSPVRYTDLVEDLVDVLPLFKTLKSKLGNDQEMAQSERNSHSKYRSGKKLNKQLGIYTKKTYSKPNGQLFSK